MIQRLTKSGGLPNPNMPSDWYPYHICAPCGITANTMTCVKRYGERPLKEAYTTSTMHKATCDVCATPDTYCTEPRDYFHPDVRAFRYLRRYLLQGGAI